MASVGTNVASGAAGVEPLVTPRSPTGETGTPLTFVVSKNLLRRHLDESQRTVIAAKIATMAHGGDRRCDQSINIDFDNTARLPPC